jgi:hypothetical protein
MKAQLYKRTGTKITPLEFMAKVCRTHSLGRSYLIIREHCPISFKQVKEIYILTNN